MSSPYPDKFPATSAPLSDDEYAQVLYWRLWEYLKLRRDSGGPQDLKDVCRAICWAINHTWMWKAYPEPAMAVVFGDHFAPECRGFKPCEDSEPDLVASHLADPAELYLTQFGIDGDIAGFAVLHDPTSPRSFLRWVGPEGDRTVVVLPFEFDQI